MEPITQQTFSKILLNKGYTRKAIFKVVKAIPHWEDLAKPLGERRSCVGIYLSEIKNNDDIFFQLVNSSGQIWREDPHLYKISSSLASKYIQEGLAKFSVNSLDNFKYEFPVELCKIAMHESELELFEHEATVIPFYSSGTMNVEIKNEMERHRMAIENILDKYRN